MAHRPLELLGPIPRLRIAKTGKAASWQDFFEELWCCCNTLTISKESPAAERIAWFATSAHSTKSGAYHEHRWFDID
jgi:hypothetical protein